MRTFGVVQNSFRSALTLILLTVVNEDKSYDIKKLVTFPTTVTKTKIWMLWLTNTENDENVNPLQDENNTT